MTFAARPVGASKRDLNLTLGRVLTKADIRDVLPVPAYPLSKKALLPSDLRVKNPSMCKKKSICPTVGSKGKFLFIKAEGFKLS